MSAARVSNPLHGSWCLEQLLPSPSMPTSVGGPVPNQSRQGRQQQRYGVEGERLVAGCIPVRYTGSQSDPCNVQVLLITSRGGKGWVFPKGGWEDDETVEAAALRETVEEAGVRGTLEEPLLGTFMFQSHKQERLHNVHQGRCRAYMYVMAVEEVLDAWPESPDRQRCWMPLLEASSKCRHQWMREALHIWIQRRGWAHLLEQQQQQQQAVAAAAAAALGQPGAVQASAGGGAAGAAAAAGSHAPVVATGAAAVAAAAAADAAS